MLQAHDHHFAVMSDDHSEVIVVNINTLLKSAHDLSVNLSYVEGDVLSPG